MPSQITEQHCSRNNHTDLLTPDWTDAAKRFSVAGGASLSGRDADVTALTQGDDYPTGTLDRATQARIEEIEAQLDEDLSCLAVGEYLRTFDRLAGELVERSHVLVRTPRALAQSYEALLGLVAACHGDHAASVVSLIAEARTRVHLLKHELPTSGWSDFTMRGNSPAVWQSDFAGLMLAS